MVERMAGPPRSLAVRCLLAGQSSLASTSGSPFFQRCAVLVVPPGVDITADIRIILVELVIWAVGKPIRVVQSRAPAPLTEHHFPGGGVEIRIDGVEGWLRQNVGAFHV